MTNLSTDTNSLFDSVAQAPGKWHLLHTKSRQEKAVSEALASKGIAHFLPLVNVTRTYGNRKVGVELPLFPSYLFLKGSLDEVYAADRTKRIANIIVVRDQDKITWELRNLAIALSQSVPLDPYHYLEVGLKARVRSGPLMGLEGLIESKTKRDRLILQVNVLGQATSLEIDSAILELVE